MALTRAWLNTAALCHRIKLNNSLSGTIPCCLQCHQILTNRGTYSCDIIGLQVIDDILYSSDAFFSSEVDLVVFATNVSCNLTNTNKNKKLFRFFFLCRACTMVQSTYIGRSESPSHFLLFHILQPYAKSFKYYPPSIYTQCTVVTKLKQTFTVFSANLFKIINRKLTLT